MSCFFAIFLDGPDAGAQIASEPRHERFDPRAAAHRMMGKPPRMPQNLDQRTSSPGLDSTPLDDAQSFEYEQADLSDDIESVAARGVSEGHEAECFAEYEERLMQCEAYSALSRDPYTYIACKANAFKLYNQCRGY